MLARRHIYIIIMAIGKVKWRTQRKRSSWNIYIDYKNRTDITPKRPKKLLLLLCCVHSTRFSIAIKERVCAYVNTRIDAQKQNHFGYCNPLFSNWNGINWNSKEWWRWRRIQSRFSNRRKKQNQLLCVQQKMKKKKKRKPRAYRRGKGEKVQYFSSQKMNNNHSTAQLKLKTEQSPRNGIQANALCLFTLFRFS